MIVLNIAVAELLTDEYNFYVMPCLQYRHSCDKLSKFSDDIILLFYNLAVWYNVNLLTSFSGTNFYLLLNLFYVFSLVLG